MQEQKLKKTMKLIYVASPYSHESKAVEEVRYLATCDFIVERLSRDPSVTYFSPIVYAHQLIKQNPHLGTTADDWVEYNWNIFHQCDEVALLRLDGWEESKGVTMELEWAYQASIPVKYW